MDLGIFPKNRKFSEKKNSKFKPILEKVDFRKV